MAEPKAAVCYRELSADRARKLGLAVLYATLKENCVLGRDPTGMVLGVVNEEVGGKCSTYDSGISDTHTSIHVLAQTLKLHTTCTRTSIMQKPSHTKMRNINSLYIHFSQ